MKGCDFQGFCGPPWMQLKGSENSIFQINGANLIDNVTTGRGPAITRRKNDHTGTLEKKKKCGWRLGKEGNKDSKEIENPCKGKKHCIGF